MTGRGEPADHHVAAFNQAVETGDWAAFAERFAEDAEMWFEGVAVGPFSGRAAIASAYAADPPSEPLIITGPVTRDRDHRVVPIRWADTAGTGVMRLRFDERCLVTRLVVAFD